MCIRCARGRNIGREVNILGKGSRVARRVASHRVVARASKHVGVAALLCCGGGGGGGGGRERHRRRLPAAAAAVPSQLVVLYVRASPPQRGVCVYIYVCVCVYIYMTRCFTFCLRNLKNITNISNVL